MIHIFYAGTIVFLFYELVALSGIKKMHSFAMNMKRLKSDQYESKHTMVGCFMGIYLLWALIGLFTFQWFVFAFLIVISLIPKKYIWVRFIDSVVTILILIFVLVNAYHLDITL